jgi:hypothetical protein
MVQEKEFNLYVYVPFFHEQSGQFWFCNSCTFDHKLYNASKQPTLLLFSNFVMFSLHI